MSAGAASSTGGPWSDRSRYTDLSQRLTSIGLTVLGPAVASWGCMPYLREGVGATASGTASDGRGDSAPVRSLCTQKRIV